VSAAKHTPFAPSERPQDFVGGNAALQAKHTPEWNEVGPDLLASADEFASHELIKTIDAALAKARGEQ
jgi:hypothetical protein